MSSARAVRPLVLAVVLLCLGATSGAAAPAPQPSSPRIVRGSDGAAAVAPAPGHWVRATFDLADGRALELFVSTALDGTVRSGARAAHPAAGRAAAAAPGVCADPAFTLGGGRWTQTLSWYYNPRLAPVTPGVAQVEAAFRDGTRSITAATNDCGRPDGVSASAAYAGRGVHDPGIVGTLCLGADGINVVGWGPMPPPILAGTCNYGLGNQIVESDILFSNLVLWRRGGGSGCTQQYDLTSVMTHERGHSFGLGHVTESAHPGLTMSESIGACDASPATLGLGDLLGLEALY